MKNEVNRALVAKKKFYLLTILCALLGINQAWGNEAKKDEGTWEGSRDWSGNHVACRIDGENSKDGKHLDIAKEADQIISWKVDEGCTINVTALKFRVGHSMLVHGGTSCDIFVNDVKVDNIGTTGGSDKEYSGYNLGNKDSFKLKFSTKVDLYWIGIVYTITPNDAPNAAEPASTTVLVSVSGDRKNVDLSQVFTLAAGVPDDFLPLEYFKNDGVIDGSNFYAESAGEYTVKARVAAVENHHNESAWSGNYVITVERRNPTLTLTTNAAAVQVEKTIDLSALIANHVGHALEYAITSSNKDNATLNGAEFSATEPGDYTVVIKSPQGDQYNETSQVVTVTVNAKPTPSFVRNFTQEEADALLVEGAIENAFTLTNVSDDENLAINVLTKTISDVKKGSEVLSYDKATNTITALNAGTATIQFVQTETEEIGAASSEVFTFTVSKHDNTLYVKGVADFAATIQPDAVLEDVVFTADNTDYSNCPINWDVKDGAEFAVFDSENKTITANYKLGTASWTLTQAESYKYKAGEATFSVKVASGEEATDCYLLKNDATEEKDRYGRTIHEHTWDDENAAGIVRFEVSNSNLNIDPGYRVQQLLDGEWQDVTETITDFPSSYVFQEQELDQAAKGVRFWVKGSLNVYVRNVSVKRKGSITAENIAVNVPVTKAGNGTLSFAYSFVNGGDLKIVCDNDKFTLDSYKVETSDCSNSTAEIPFTFAAQDAVGVHTANITIYNDVLYKQLTITANVIKITPVVDTKPAASEITYGQMLSKSELTGGVVKDGEDDVDGSFSWADGTELLDAGIHEKEVVFTPTNTDVYEQVRFSVDVKINQKEIEILDVNKDTVYLMEGDALNDDILKEITSALAKIFTDVQEWLSGIFTWTSSQTEAKQEDEEYEVTFTPDDTNYAAAPAKVRVKVAPKVPTAVINLEDGKTSVKILRDGQVLILRDGKVYNLNGLEVR